LTLFYDQNRDFGRPTYTLTGPQTGFAPDLNSLASGLNDNIDSVFMYPFADPGGPYVVAPGVAIALNDAGRCYGPVPGPYAETYSWRVVGAPGCSFDDPTASQPTLMCTEEGTFEIQLTVAEPAPYWIASEATATTQVTVKVPPPPTTTDGHQTGLLDPGSGKWYLYDNAGALAKSFCYGNPGDYPFMGDWDGDEIETPGLYRQSDGYAYLRNSNSQGIADIKFFFGNPGDVPIAGDFNGDGYDTLSIYRPSNQTFYIINKLGENDGGLGAAETTYVFGNPGDKPFVGDFDGDDSETVGLHRESTGFVYFRNSHTQGNADAQFFFGDPGDRLIAGDWNNDGKFSPALFRPSNTTMYFRYTNTQGNADSQLVPTPNGASWLPVSGTR
jgi:hypothetical protein